MNVKHLRMAGVALVTKFVVLLVGYQSYIIISNRPINSFYRALYIWKHWDAKHYLKIAEDGYVSVGDDRFLIVFFPLYPLLTALSNFVFRDVVASAFFVSFVASILLAIAFRELVALDHSERISQFAVVLMFIFPTSFFLHIPYTESLFLALAVGTFLMARKRRWILVGILGFLACTSRVNGLVLFPALLFEIWDEYRGRRELNWQWVFILGIPLGFLAYLLLNYYVTGSPIRFMEYQRENWQRYLRLPWWAFAEVVRSIWNPEPVRSMMGGIQELLYVLIGLGGIVLGWTKLRASYRVWMILNWLLFISTSFVLSVPRYTIVLFPLFIVMSIYSNSNKLLRLFFVLWSIMFLSLFTAQFAVGRWAF